MASSIRYRFPDPEQAARLLLRRGYRALADRASGMLFQRSDRYVHLAPDGEAQALAKSYWPAWAADRELAESATNWKGVRQ